MKFRLYGVVAAALSIPADASAQTVVLRDFVVAFDTKTRALSSTVQGPEDGQETMRFTAIAGTLVSHFNGWGDGCNNSTLAMVYKPGALADTVECAPTRTGTSTNYDESGTAAKFQTTTTISGNLVTLRGKITGRTTQNSSNCGKKSGRESAFDITETLSFRVAGRTCQVIEYTRVHVRTVRETHNDDGAALETKTYTITHRRAPNAKCTFTVASQQPVTPPPPGMVGLRPGRCD